jgi:hypothetical protein
MEELQQVRNRFPDSEWAQPALERTTALYRLYGGPKPAFAADPSFSPAAGDVMKDVRALAVDRGGGLWVASEKTRSAVLIDSGGELATSLGAEAPRALSVAQDGVLVFASQAAVRVGPKDVRSLSTPPDKPGDAPKPVDKILAAALTAGGALLVSDEERERVLRYDAKGRAAGSFPPSDTAKRKVTRIVVDGEGGIVTLDREDKTVRVWDEAGKPLRVLGPAGLKRPVDVAGGPFRNLFVADEEQGVRVFDTKETRFATRAGPELRRARAVALDATGAVLVYDDRAERVVRYR